MLLTVSSDQIQPSRTSYVDGICENVSFQIYEMGQIFHFGLLEKYDKCSLCPMHLTFKWFEIIYIQKFYFVFDIII